MKKLLSTIITLILLISAYTNITVFANNDNTLKYYLGDVVNTEKDNGYSEKNQLKQKDPHYGWTLGRFFVDGYTRAMTDKNQTPIFLKNVGDKVTLWFNLEQDINKLNGKDSLTISEDKNGYDTQFGVEKQNFGKGTLIIKHTDYQNLSKDPVVYTNYLSATAKKGKDIEVELFEEGDYEVALDYEIKNDPRNLWGLSVFPSYTNYKIHFTFSVRNGNCMVYPFDAKTGAELSNKAFTENGFYLDLAKSRYLTIDLKKEVLNESAEGLTEDTRFNRPAKDGDKYTEEGIYTITVTNKYTEMQTVKKIYVGKNDVLRAYVTTGYSIQDINNQLKKGAEINEDGTMSYLVGEPVSKENNGTETFVHIDDVPTDVSDTSSTTPETNIKWVIIGAVGIVLIALSVCIFIKIKARKKPVVEEVSTSEGEVEDDE